MAAGTLLGFTVYAWITQVIPRVKVMHIMAGTPPGLIVDVVLWLLLDAGTLGLVSHEEEPRSSKHFFQTLWNLGLPNTQELFGTWPGPLPNACWEPRYLPNPNTCKPVCL
jgi:hypothetical protein